MSTLMSPYGYGFVGVPSIITPALVSMTPVDKPDTLFVTYNTTGHPSKSVYVPSSWVSLSTPRTLNDSVYHVFDFSFDCRCPPLSNVYSCCRKSSICPGFAYSWKRLYPSMAYAPPTGLSLPM